MQEAETGKPVLAFVLREESEVIRGLPKSRHGTVYVEWRFGLFGLRTDRGRVVAYLAAMVKTPGGISETNINVLHLDEETISVIEAEDPLVLIFIGDSRQVERQILVPVSKNFGPMIERALWIFQDDPWTDKDYDEAKAHFQETMTLEEAWRMAGRR